VLAVAQLFFSPLSVFDIDAGLLAQLAHSGHDSPPLHMAAEGLTSDVCGLAVVLRQNSESTELHSLTMLQPCSQGVDLKVDPHFGEGQPPWKLSLQVTQEQFYRPLFSPDSSSWDAWLLISL
jgi:hypothetical protein